MTLLTTQHLTVEIGSHRVCTDLSLDLQANQTWAVLGGNGVGKTTLLHTLAGLRPPQLGQIRLKQHPLAQLKRRDIAREIGILFQQEDDPFPSSVLETTLIGRHPFIGNWRSESVEDFAIARQALEAVDLDGFADRPSTTLSGGERQRLKIATLLTQAPQIMLLDEPTNHLDLNHQIRLLTLLIEVSRERQGLILMALHDLNLARRFCTHALLLSRLTGPLFGPIEEVLQQHHLESAYGWPIEEITAGGKTFYFPR